MLAPLDQAMPIARFQNGAISGGIVKDLGDALAQRLGLRVQDSDGALVVKQVLLEGAGLAAGLSAGDEIVACNGWRVRKLDDLPLTLDTSDPHRLELLVTRDQRMLTLVLMLPTQDSAANTPYSPTVSHKPLCANSAMLSRLTASQQGQLSTHLRASSHCPTRLPAVGRASPGKPLNSSSSSALPSPATSKHQSRRRSADRSSTLQVLGGEGFT